MSLRGLEERLTALQETTTQLRELIDRLANLEFQPGAVPQETVDEEGSPSGELSAEIGQVLRSGVEEQELLAEEARFVRPEGAEKTTLREGVERLGAELVSCRGQFRKARLSARERLAQARRTERRLLMQSYAVVSGAEAAPSPRGDEPVGEGEARRRRRQQQQQQQQQQQVSGLSEEDQRTVGASDKVTAALRRTHDLIAAELFRSEYAHQTLEESSAALRELDDSYRSLDSMLASSRHLLGTLLRSQKSDTWYLQTALYMLAVTGAWLLFRRLLYGPAWWLVWLPLRVLFGIGARAGGAVMQQRSTTTEPPEKAVDGGALSVDGLPDEHLPTAQVGHETAGEADAAMDEIARIVDAANEANGPGNMAHLTDTDETTGDKATNTKKRMWDEDEVLMSVKVEEKKPAVVEEAETQQRDEL